MFFIPNVNGVNREFMERLGLCLHCWGQAWRIHCEEHNARSRGAFRFPLIALRLGVWRLWLNKRLAPPRPPWRDFWMVVGGADSYVRVRHTQALAARRCA